MPVEPARSGETWTWKLAAAPSVVEAGGVTEITDPSFWIVKVKLVGLALAA